VLQMIFLSYRKRRGAVTPLPVIQRLLILLILLILLTLCSLSRVSISSVASSFFREFSVVVFIWLSTILLSIFVLSHACYSPPVSVPRIV